MRIELLFGALLGFAVALPPVLRNSTTAVAENLKRNLSAINGKLSQKPDGLQLWSLFFRFCFEIFLSDLDYQNSNRLKRIVIGSRRREEEVNEPALPAPDRNRVAAQVAAQQSQSKNGEVKSASPLPDDDYDCK